MLKLIAPALVLGSAAFAQPRIAVVGVGGCDDPALTAMAHEFAQAVAGRHAAAVLDEGDLAARLGAPSRTVEELQTRLDEVKRHFYAAEYHKADQKLLELVKDLRRLPMRSDRWSLTVSAELLVGLLARGADRASEARAAFRRVLRLDPTLQLDADYYAPSTRVEFERVRRELASEQTFELEQLRFCEFFIVAEDLSWIVFDTHHNSLVGHGDSLGLLPAGSRQ